MNMRMTALIMLLVMSFSAVSMAAENREDIHASADQVQPLLIGMKAPAFTVRDVENKTVKFNAGAQTKPIVLTFFRGGWCPYCNLHLSEMLLSEEQNNLFHKNYWPTKRPSKRA